MCSYTDTWMGELYENEYPLVSKGVWSGIINLKTHKLLNSKPEYGSLYLQAKVCDSGTYFLLDKDKKTICKIADYVPNGLIPEVDGCGDYIRPRINEDDMIEVCFPHSVRIDTVCPPYIRIPVVISISKHTSYFCFCT